ncbi:MAG TPA: choice-of-anchor Q domain-containing protein, partial [Chthoniobacterales bacterium]
MSVRPLLTIAAALIFIRAIHATDQVVTDPGDNGGAGGANQLRAKLTACLSTGGGTITFTIGTATITLNGTPLPFTDQNVTIDGGGTVTISGANSSIIFGVNSATLTLKNLTVTKGLNTGSDGGAVRNANPGTLVIDNCHFLNNQTNPAFSGGAIWSTGPLTITNSEFGSNAAGNGGALFPRFSNAVVNITNCNFHDNKTLNTTNGWGGAMLIWDGAQVIVNNSQFMNNAAQSGSFSSSTINRGGAIYVFANSNLKLNNSLLAGNSACFGGALYVDPSGTLAVTGGELHDNSITVFDGTQGGGAIYNAGTLTVAVDVQLHDNHADGAGGAIENAPSGSMVILSRVVLRHNQAGGGGAIENRGNAIVQESTLADNIASLYGGAIDAADETDTTKSTTVFGCTLSGNSAGTDGGAIESEMKLTLTDTTISGNSGPEAIADYDRPITVTNVTIAQNTGMGLNLHGSPTVMLRNTLLASNAGGNCSGAITSSGFNLSDDNTCTSVLNQPGDQNGKPAQLGPLANNGGATQTHLPQPGSPAV